MKPFLTYSEKMQSKDALDKLNGELTDDRSVLKTQLVEKDKIFQNATRITDVNRETTDDN